MTVVLGRLFVDVVVDVVAVVVVVVVVGRGISFQPVCRT